MRTFNEHGYQSGPWVSAARTLDGMDEFIGSVGPSEIHDATIVHVDVELDRLVVTVRCGNASQARLRIEFSDPVEVERKRAVGMTLYSLAELRGAGERRRFSFVNWDETDDARLEVEASAISWLEVES